MEARRKSVIDLLFMHNDSHRQKAQPLNPIAQDQDPLTIQDDFGAVFSYLFYMLALLASTCSLNFLVLV